MLQITDDIRRKSGFHLYYGKPRLFQLFNDVGVEQ